MNVSYTLQTFKFNLVHDIHANLIPEASRAFTMNYHYCRAVLLFILFSKACTPK